MMSNFKKSTVAPLAQNISKQCAVTPSWTCLLRRRKNLQEILINNEKIHNIQDTQYMVSNKRLLKDTSIFRCLSCRNRLKEGLKTPRTLCDIYLHHLHRFIGLVISLLSRSANVFQMISDDKISAVGNTLSLILLLFQGGRVHLH